jgi:hypothetical protein
MFFSFSALCYILSALPSATGLRQVRHDVNFQPDYVLRVTQQTIAVACRTRLSAVVNGVPQNNTLPDLIRADIPLRLGTSPGPPIYLKENQTTWIRVYNDFASENLTMVR